MAKNEKQKTKKHSEKETSEKQVIPKNSKKQCFLVTSRCVSTIFHHEKPKKKNTKKNMKNTSPRAKSAKNGRKNKKTCFCLETPNSVPYQLTLGG